MINDKNECIESITKALEKTAAWRKLLTARWPNDPRNARANSLLCGLAAEAVNLTDAQWSELEKQYNWASETWITALNQATRQVGFYHRNGDLASFITALVNSLHSSSVAA